MNRNQLRALLFLCIRTREMQVLYIKLDTVLLSFIDSKKKRNEDEELIIFITHQFAAV